jgi:hypothetical protein
MAEVGAQHPVRRRGWPRHRRHVGGGERGHRGWQVAAAPVAATAPKAEPAPARRAAWVVRPSFALYSLVLSLAALSTVLTNLADQLLSSTGWSP